jgi:glycosyltransferase involved in cell wall biosynthesis
MKKILLISPINRWGGVNIDVGFIAQFYSHNGCDVNILSTGDYYEDCSIFSFITKHKFSTLNRLVLERYPYLKFILKILNLIKPMGIPISHRVNNKFFTQKFNLESKYKEILKDHIARHDAIFICNHLTGKFNDKIVKTSFSLSKKIFLRVTGQINEKNLSLSDNIHWLNYIDYIIYHSFSNKNVASKYLIHPKHVIIDQCVFNEEAFLKKETLKKCESFYILGRLEKLKNIDHAIEAFKKTNDNKLSLNIYGSGSQLNYLKKISDSDKRIKIYHSVKLEQVSKIHKKHDCLIISSSIEGGPYTGLEAMAAGNIIISTRVGAMEKRLGRHYVFFYDNSIMNDLLNKINEIVYLKIHELKNISIQNKEQYFRHYRCQIIEKQYLRLLEF